MTQKQKLAKKLNFHFGRLNDAYGKRVNPLHIVEWLDKNGYLVKDQTHGTQTPEIVDIDDPTMPWNIRPD